MTVECSTPAILDFKRNAPLAWLYDGQKAGTFYVQSIRRVAPQLYYISAASKIGLLSAARHMGGIYEGAAVADVVKEICAAAGVTAAVKTNIAPLKLYGWLPIATARENLAQVLFAVGATAKVDMTDELRIEELWDGVSGLIPQDRLYMDSTVEYSADVSAVTVTEHQYSKGGDETTLFDGTAKQGDVITFSAPYYDLKAEGVRILESGANYAVVSEGTGTLKGRAYVHVTREVTKTVNADVEDNTKRADNATLVSLLNSEAVAKRMANYYKCTQAISAAVICRREIPGDIVNIYHPFEEQVGPACLESESITLSGTLRGQSKSTVGFAPIAANANLVNHVEVLTGSGTWTPPEGVEEFRAVLIQGGEGGAKGEDTDASAWEQASTQGMWIPDAVGWQGYVFGGTAGRKKGGSGGNGGAAGKIQEVAGIKASGPVTYICGAAAKNGGARAETTFGEYTTADGRIYEAGFLDPVTGLLYGVPGKDGENGGDGGFPGNSGAGTQHAAGGTGTSVGETRKTITKSDGAAAGNYGSVEVVAVGGTGNNGKMMTGGGGAGGSSGDNRGEPGGTTASALEFAANLYYGTWSIGVRTQAGGRGGKGANGQDAATYGSGGYGGGGAGGNGATTGANVYIASMSYYAGSQAPYIGYVNTIEAGGNGMISGGQGGAGADGCVLVYYSTREPVGKPVRFVDKNGKKLLDKYSRHYVT